MFNFLWNLSVSHSFNLPVTQGPYISQEPLPKIWEDSSYRKEEFIALSTTL